MLLTICKSSEKISLNHSKFFKSLSFYIHIHMCIEVRTRVSFLFPSIDQANQPHSQAGSPIAHTRADYSDPVPMSTGSEPRIPGSSDSRCLGRAARNQDHITISNVTLKISLEAREKSPDD